jgi:hypothetical protein
MQYRLKTMLGHIQIEISVINFATILLFRAWLSVLEGSTRVYFACLSKLFTVVHPAARIFS